MNNSRPIRPLIALTGPARNGKNTIADILEANYGFTQLAFADKLKEALLKLNPFIPVVSTDNYEEFCESVETAKATNTEEDITIFEQSGTRLANLISLFGWEEAKDLFPEVRALLQRLGTEAGWQIHGEFLWPKALERSLNKLAKTQPVVISDLRFPAEVSWVKKNGGIVVKVNRPNLDHNMSINANHASEIEILNYDYLITNNGTLDELEQKVAKLVVDIETKYKK